MLHESYNDTGIESKDIPNVNIASKGQNAYTNFIKTLSQRHIGNQPLV